MNRKNIFFLLPIVFSIGCASLKSEVFSNIHAGDKKEHLLEILGEPTSFGPSQRIAGGEAWYYKRRSETCGFTLVEGVVQAMVCERDPNYRNPAAAALGAMGDSLTESSRQNNNRTINCTSNRYGDSVYTNCR